MSDWVISNEPIEPVHEQPPDSKTKNLLERLTELERRVERLESRE